MTWATALGCDAYTAWLAFTSTTVDSARFDIGNDLAEENAEWRTPCAGQSLLVGSRMATGS
jgi:hypothetical protein